MKTIQIVGCSDCPCTREVYDSGACYVGEQCLLSKEYMECDGPLPAGCPLRRGPVALRLVKDE